MEVWKPVRGYEGYYEVSNLGNVWRVSETELYTGKLVGSNPIDRNIYRTVTLTKAGKTETKGVHVLVLEAFTGPRPGSMVVNHRDGDKQNNTLNNLDWVTQRVNILHARHLAANPRPCKATPEAIREQVVLRLPEYSNSELAKMSGLSVTTISKIRRAQG